ARLDTARQVVARPERSSLAGAALDRLPRARRRPDLRVVALGQLPGVARVPEDGDEDVHGPPGALDVAVERAVEPLAAVARHERVDQTDGVGRLQVDGADVLLPFVVESGPAPEAGRDLLDVH